LDNAFIENFGLLMVDANGLKVVNDAFGHDLGDKVITETARVLETLTRKGDLVFRLGGDEFAVVLRDYDEEEIRNLKARLKLEINGITISHIPLSVSIGHAFHKVGQLNFNALFSEAENDMYRDKMLSNKRVTDDILAAIFAELVERHPWERSHSLFCADAAKAVAQALDLGDEFSDVIYDVGLYHSIGKIGLDLDVYLDAGSLVENQGKYESHNEIAFRILSAMPEHSYMAASILYYNESYDGSGKPKGLMGEDIPLASRIIRVVTTFHKSMLPPHEGIGTFNYEEAREHFMSHKGILYDPKVVDAFFELFDNDIENKTGLYLYDLV
jgi:diguanylate cyclase (GGDEF)-like protein